MKKTLIITLLIALVLGVFTACNGDVNADISGDTERTITLILEGNYWKFDNDTDTLVINIPSTCNTWKDLKNAGCTITVQSSTIAPTTLTLNSYSLTDVEYAGFTNTSFQGRVYFISKAAAYTPIDSEIEIGGTYGIYVVKGN